MSVHAMSWAKGRSETIASQAILFAISDYADEWGITYVGQDTLADDCSCRKATVADNLKRLEGLHLIARVRRHDQRGHRTSDHIVLAPLAADRGGMRDADKRATEKHPAEVVELARHLDTPSVTSPDTASGTRPGHLDTAHERLVTPGVPEPSGEPEHVRADALSCQSRDANKIELPNEFEHLRPHLKTAYRVLHELAERHNAKAINPQSLASIVLARSHKPIVRAALDCAAHWDSHKRTLRDVVAAYRNWLDRCEDLAGFEHLDQNGYPAGSSFPQHPGNVVPLQRAGAVQRRDRWAAGYADEGRAS